MSEFLSKIGKEFVIVDLDFSSLLCTFKSSSELLDMRSMRFSTIKKFSWWSQTVQVFSFKWGDRGDMQLEQQLFTSRKKFWLEKLRSERLWRLFLLELLLPCVRTGWGSGKNGLGGCCCCSCTRFVGPRRGIRFPPLTSAGTCSLGPMKAWAGGGSWAKPCWLPP